MTLQARFVRMSDTQAVFGVTDDTVRDWSKSGGFDIYKIGGASLVSVEEVTAFIRRSAIKSGG